MPTAQAINHRDPPAVLFCRYGCKGSDDQPRSFDTPRGLHVHRALMHRHHYRALNPRPALVHPAPAVQRAAECQVLLSLRFTPRTVTGVDVDSDGTVRVFGAPGNVEATGRAAVMH